MVIMKLLLVVCVLVVCVRGETPCATWSLADSYDVIIVGSGIGGSVAARRLAEKNPSWSILLLERGISWDECTECAAPGRATNALRDDQTGLYINTVPQTGLPNNLVVALKDPAVQGGGSSVNQMFHIRCDSERYFNTYWPSSWGWSTMRPYFEKYENYTFPQNYYDSPTFDYSSNSRGSSGPVKITQTNEDFGNGIQARALTAINKIFPNLPVYPNNSLNNEGKKGLGSAPLEILSYNGLRSSAYIAYLKSYTGSNLKLVTRVRTDKILFTGTKATGVQIITYDTTTGKANTSSTACQVKAARAVIVSAGALGTPKLLKLSGVGPKNELQKVGVSVVVDNSDVGEHLNDHYTAFALLSSSNNEFPVYTDQANNFFSSYWNNNDVVGAIPDFCIKLTSAAALGTIVTGIATTCVMETSSYGYVRLSSSNPDDNPLVDVAYLSNTTDKVNLATTLSNALSLSAELGFSLFSLTDPCQDGPCSTATETLDTYISASSTRGGTHGNPGYHFTATSSIGKVVNVKDLSVKGTTGLYVLDASIFPYAPPGNPTSPIYAVSERGAEVIHTSLHSDSTFLHPSFFLLFLCSMLLLVSANV